MERPLTLNQPTHPSTNPLTHLLFQPYLIWLNKGGVDSKFHAFWNLFQLSMYGQGATLFFAHELILLPSELLDRSYFPLWVIYKAPFHSYEETFWPHHVFDL